MNEFRTNNSTIGIEEQTCYNILMQLIAIDLLSKYISTKRNKLLAYYSINNWTVIEFVIIRYISTAPEPSAARSISKRQRAIIIRCNPLHSSYFIIHHLHKINFWHYTRTITEQLSSLLSLDFFEQRHNIQQHVRYWSANEQ